MANSYNGIPFGNEKEKNALISKVSVKDIRYKRTHIVGFHVTELFRKIQIYKNRKKISNCLGLVVNTETDCKWHMGLLRMTQIF